MCIRDSPRRSIYGYPGASLLLNPADGLAAPADDAPLVPDARDGLLGFRLHSRGTAGRRTTRIPFSARRRSSASARRRSRPGSGPRVRARPAAVAAGRSRPRARPGPSPPPRPRPRTIPRIPSPPSIGRVAPAPGRARPRAGSRLAARRRHPLFFFHLSVVPHGGRSDDHGRGLRAEGSEGETV